MRKLRGGMMPPQGHAQAGTGQDRRIDHLASDLARSSRARRIRSRDDRPLHRLNRTEYANAIRDLLGLKVDVTALLPADDESNGFDNIAEVLRVSPSLLEAYLAASREVSSLAVGDPKIGPISQSIQVPPDLAQSEHIEGLPLGHARRNSDSSQFSAGRRLRVQRDSAAEHRRVFDRHGVSASAGSQHRWPAGVSRAGGRRRRSEAGGYQPGAGGRHLGRALEDQGAREGRAARCCGDVPAARFGGIGRAAAAVHARLGFAEHERHPADRSRADHRAV